MFVDAIAMIAQELITLPGCLQYPKKNVNENKRCASPYCLVAPEIMKCVLLRL
jgi:hypothetical protein